MKYNSDSSLMKLLSRIADLIILNVLFLVCCIPIVTAGASVTALYYVCMRLVRCEENGIVHSFFRSFRQNFRQSTIIWILMIVLGLMIYVDFQIFNVQKGLQTEIARMLVIVAGAVLFMIVLYVFPLLARFSNRLPDVIRNACLLSISNLPKTIIMSVFTAGIIGITFLNEYTFTWGILLWLMIGFSAVTYVNSYFMVHIFKNLGDCKEKEE